MADDSKKVPGNVPGKYYVDDSCSSCGLCADTAPDNFKMNNDGSAAFVYKQPGSAKEEADSKSAMEDCPSNSIGDNG